MADRKITELTATTAPATTDIVPIVTDPSGSPATKKVTVRDLLATGRTVNPQTADYTLALTDAGSIVQANKATAITITVPANATVAFPTGTTVDVESIGVGTTTVAAAGGVTINSPGSVLTLTQFASLRLVKTATNTWNVLSLSGTSGALTRIDQQVKGSAGATFDFAAIPATYESLILEVMGRSTAAATAVNLLLRINGDSSAIYDIQDINGASATLTAFATTAGTSARVGAIAAGNATAGKVGVARIQVPNYARTVFHKVFQSDSAFFQDESSGYNKDQAVGLWRSTAAIARLTLSLSSGNFDIGSVATLYGVGSPL